MEEIAAWRFGMAKKELICPECGQTGFGSAAGLRGHRQFKHGVPPSSPQLPLEQQDRLITESVLEQRIEQALGEFIEQVGSEVAAIKQQLKQLAEQPLEQPNSALANEVSELGQRLDVMDRDYREDQGFAVVFGNKVKPLEERVAGLSEVVESLKEEEAGDINKVRAELGKRVEREYVLAAVATKLDGDFSIKQLSNLRAGLRKMMGERPKRSGEK